MPLPGFDSPKQEPFYPPPLLPSKDITDPIVRSALPRDADLRDFEGFFVVLEGWNAHETDLGDRRFLPISGFKSGRGSTVHQRIFGFLRSRVT
ncbi:hypothetical protein KM043_005456 [Ampulex compressa]|nr:hypothetical protein KM043_005456 [Ampulex compressa]